ncbi:MAG: glycosyltransferase [Anaerolineae bacterium]|nr:glycosyltransferase [Anaerolineae bacterium]
MRLLFLTAELPEPAHAGGTLRTNGLLRAAHAAGHEVHLLSFATRAQLNAQRERLAAYCARVETVSPPQRRLSDRLRDLLLTDKADMQGRYCSAHYQHALSKLLEETPYDLIQMESLEMTIYAPTVRRIQPTTPLIYDSFNAEADLQRSIFEAERGSVRRLPGALYSFVQWRRLTRYERRVVREATHTIAVSDADAEAFRRLAPDCPVSVVPNGIDVARYAVADTTLDLGPASLVFTGSMGYRPNVDAALWFANRVLDRVQAHVPQARFFIVGSQPHRRLGSLRDHDGVQITGWVPDVQPFLSAAAVYVVPLRMGSGTRLKLLQAMAARLAVVSTRVGAQGLDVQDGVQLRLADTEEDFARAVIELLSDPAERAALGERAAKYVAHGYDWSVIAPRLLAVYDDVLGAGGAGQG